MAYSWAPRCPFIVLASNQSQESKRLTTWGKAGKCQRKAERPAFTCSFVKPSRHLDVGKTSATPLTKEYRNRNAPELSAQRLLSLAQYQPEQTQGPSELPQAPRPLPCAPYTAAPRPGPGAGAQAARASAGPPPRRASPTRDPFPQLLPHAAGPEAPPRALGSTRGPRRPSAQAAPEQQDAAGPRRHASPPASEGPAAASPARPACRAHARGPQQGSGALGGAEPGRGGAAGGRGVAGDSAPTAALSPVARERRKGLDIHCGLQAPCPYGPAAACGLHGYVERDWKQESWFKSWLLTPLPYGFYNCGVLDISRRAIALLEFVVPLKQSEFVMRKQKASK